MHTIVFKSIAQVNRAGLTFDEWLSKVNEELSVRDFTLSDLSTDDPRQAWEEHPAPGFYATDVICKAGLYEVFYDFALESEDE